MADDLSPADRSSLSAEQGSVNMAVGGVIVLEEGPGVTHEAIRARVGERIHLLPRYRQRLEAPAPGVLNPVWVDDPQFDLGWHVRRVRVSGDAELAEVVGQEMSRKLDRGRPLWELSVIEGLDGGRVAILPKMHHALVDGIAAVDIGTVLMDPTPEPLDLPPPDEDWAPRPYDRRRHLSTLGVKEAARWSKLLRQQTVRYSRDWTAPLSDAWKASELARELVKTRPSAPMTTLNRPIGPNRRYAMVRTELAPLKAAGKAAGGTFNDAVLAIVAGTLRRALGPPGRQGSRPVALVPVSVRKEDDDEGGNRISTLLVDLPTDVADPQERIRQVHAAMARIKSDAAVRAGSLLVGASGWAPPVVSAGLARAMGGVRAFNLVVSNVPGPQQPFYMNGSRVLAAYPCVPLNPGSQGLTVGVLSYDGGVQFGLLADRDLEPDLEGLAEHLRASIGEVLAGVVA